MNEPRVPKPMKLVFWRVSDATENEIKLIAAYYATVFLHFRNEVWMSDLLGERMRTLNDNSGVSLALTPEIMEKWRSYTGVQILRDSFQMGSSDQLKFCRTLLINQAVVPTVDGIEYEFIYNFTGFFTHTQQDNLTY